MNASARGANQPPTENSWARIVIGFLVLFLIARVIGGSTNAAILSVPAAAGIACLVSGVMVWRNDPHDPTARWRIRARPDWLCWTTVITCGFSALLLLTGGAVGLAIILAAVAVGVWASRLRRPQRPHSTRSEEDTAIDRAIANPHMFVTAGLAEKSPNTGLWITPQIVGAAIDDLGRPFIAVEILAGHQTISQWEKAGPRLASAWMVPRVQVTHERTNVVRLTAVLREFVRTGPVAWQHRPFLQGMTVAEYLSALPMGEVADRPLPWVQDLREANLTVGGTPGAGKSVYLNSLLAHFALCPFIDIAFIDLKAGREAQKWRGRLSALATTQEEAVELIGWLLGQVKLRYRRMTQENAWHGSYLGQAEHVWVLVVDEAAELFMGATRAQRELADQANELLRSLVSLGRAAGVVVVLSTQKPTGDTLPVAIRDLTNSRVAFKVMSDGSAVAILGSDWFGAVAQFGADAASPLTITRTQKGTAVVASDEGDYYKVQGAWIDRNLVDRIVDDTRAWTVLWDARWDPRRDFDGIGDTPATAATDTLPILPAQPRSVTAPPSPSLAKVEAQAQAAEPPIPATPASTPNPWGEV